MSDFELGQRVRFAERLVRVSIYTPYSGGYSVERSEELLQKALDRMGVSRSRGGTTFRHLDWKLWVPESFAREHLHSGLTMLKYVYGVPAAGEGVIVQRATLQQGGTHWDGDEGRLWMDHGTTRAYKVAFDINRTPIHVLPEHITALEEVSE
ncbi:hypothetical protein PP358_gp65 [Arthrobacter phage Shoya]|uniref:Uncharacterized protein n=1 Tax=Arthrobacter phage Shoya TaxID=2704035 RepID=A0A6G6XI91_9CAUD|nr:hypothetical protein PP358_gp65 [Arthrobacter phage Shoya]QIG57736.1 hypothetical protein SEA_SHOYA_65 [Arthrobacter phage Shoya]